MLPDGYDPVAIDMKTATDVFVVQRKNARDPSERWFEVQSSEPSEIGEPSCWTGARISDAVEVGLLEYDPESVTPPD